MLSTVVCMSIETLAAGLNPEQQTAVRHLDGPLLVVAGPGSGKTRVLTHRVAALVDAGVAPRSILALTFTNKAAEEMRERIGHLVDEHTAKDLWVSTFHSFCLRVLRRYANKVELPQNFTVLDRSDAERTLKIVMRELGHDVDDARQYQSAISFAKNQRHTPADLAARGGTNAAIAEVFERYQQQLTKQAAVDFDDLLTLTLRLVTGDENVLRALRARFQRILVDEWQDTNAVQYEIVARIAAESQQLCVVGDQQQAIYGWRGSTPEVLNQFIADFPDAEVVVLDRNYRSTPQIVEVSQAIIDASPNRFETALRTDNPDGDQVRCIELYDGEEEARFVVRQLQRAEGSKAILLRTNAQTRLFEQELTRARVPYQLVGTVRFFDRAEVRDALAYLRVLVNPADALAVARAAGIPKKGLGDASVDALLATAEDLGVAPGDALTDERVLAAMPTRACNGLARFASDLDSVREAAEHGVGPALQRIVSLGVGAYHREKDTERGENLDELVAAGATFDLEGSPALAGVDHSELSGIDRLASFLESVTLTSSADASADGDAVSVVTAHASKGREWDHVWVVGVEDNLYPHSLSRTAAEIEEERRLFFVACSRAAKTLTLTHRNRRFLNGSWEPAKPSPFLSFLPDSVLRQQHTSNKATGGGYNRNGGYNRRRPAKSSTSKQRSAVTGFPARQAPRSERSVPAAAPRVAAGPRLSPDDCVAGLVVTHPTFGAGVVESVNGNEATIRFEERTRVLDLGFAPLSVDS